MKPAVRTTLLIGACEWGDLEAVERLLELGAFFLLGVVTLFEVIFFAYILLIMLYYIIPLCVYFECSPIIARSCSDPCGGLVECCVSVACDSLGHCFGCSRSVL